MRRYLVFSVVSLGLFVSSIATYSPSVAVPAMTSDLNTSIIMVGWVLTVYSLVRTIAMPLAGKISEMLGRKITFIAYTLIFTVGSTLCALSPNIYLLIGARAVQAIGAGGFMPCASGIVSDEFPEARQRYIGLFTSIFPIGMIVGPNLGGWMVEAFGWRSVFWFNVPLGIVVLVLSSVLLAVETKEKATINIDFAGAGLLFCSLTALMISLTEVGNSKLGIPWILVGGLFTVGIALVVPFLHRERRAREPIIDLELLRRRPFLAANFYNLIYGACSLGISSLMPLYAVSIYKMSTLESGIILTPRSVGVIIASFITSFYIAKWGYRWPIIAGTLMLALSLALLALQPQGIEVMGFRLGSTPLLFVILGLCGIGAGVSSPGSNNACIELMPDKVATIIGLRGMFRQLGSGIGVALATVLISNIGDMQRAFYVIMLAAAVMFLVSIPAVFAMPASANVKPIRD